MNIFSINTHCTAHFIELVYFCWVQRRCMRNSLLRISGFYWFQSINKHAQQMHFSFSTFSLDILPYCLDFMFFLRSICLMLWNVKLFSPEFFCFWSYVYFRTTPKTTVLHVKFIRTHDNISLWLPIFAQIVLHSLPNKRIEEKRALVGGTDTKNTEPNIGGLLL